MQVLHSPLICFTFLAAAISAQLFDSSAVLEESLHHENWQNFKAQYNKTYGNAEEELSRFQIFKASLVRAALRNMSNPLANFGLTRFSDLSPAEFKQHYLGYRPRLTHGLSIPHVSRAVKQASTNFSLSGNVDWRNSGAVTPVKDQGECGSCWAHSAVGGVESAWFLKHGTLPVLSVQQVVDCDTVDHGCNGGDLPSAFGYIQTNGLELDSSYPDPMEETFCTYSQSAVIANITGFVYATSPCPPENACNHQDERTLLNNLADSGPVSICVFGEPWQDYQSGIFTDPTCVHTYSDLDHCVQLVGYNGSGTHPYWIVRNSWGSDWGENGYIYVKYGWNLCGVADEATLVIAA